jgi:hypothetical protein
MNEKEPLIYDLNECKEQKTKLFIDTVLSCIFVNKTDKQNVFSNTIHNTRRTQTHMNERQTERKKKRTTQQ